MYWENSLGNGYKQHFGRIIEGYIIFLTGLSQTSWVKVVWNSSIQLTIVLKGYLEPFEWMTIFLSG